MGRGFDEHRANEGRLYCCAIKDLCRNRIVGYSIGDRMNAALAVNAMNNAVARRGDVAGCILHADRGSQFRPRKMAAALNRHGMGGSMGRVASVGDNAAMESVWSLLQTNVLNQQRWRARQDLRLAIVVWIEKKYHRQRGQDPLGGLTPIEFEATITQTRARVCLTDQCHRIAYARRFNSGQRASPAGPTASHSRAEPWLPSRSEECCQWRACHLHR
jgi:putative transposase